MLGMNILKQLSQATEYVQKRVQRFPRTVVVTGSGLGPLVDDLEIEAEIAYHEIPYVNRSTVQGHAGSLAVGRLGSSRVAFMRGRLHYYEGYSMRDVVFPFRVFANCGASTFILTNASGALHEAIHPTSLVLITDHINLMGSNPLVGSNCDELGPRFPDMSRLYDSTLNAVCLKTAVKLGVELREGIYVGLHGPSYETPAEIRMYRKLGGDIVGMSTVPEAIALRHMGKRVAAISCVTNYAAGVATSELIHEEVLQNAHRAQVPFAKLIRAVLHEIQDA
jgi:purine-nucleoside phosphorylase